MEVLLLGDSRLHETASRVEIFDEHLRGTVEQMLETMRAHDGIGLAAPQVGISEQIIVMRVSGEGSKKKRRKRTYVMINPSIENRSEHLVKIREGCLSVPNTRYLVDRHEKVTVSYQDMDGNLLKVRLDGMAAVCDQHEIDHLQGILISEKGEAAPNIPG